jgi:hypothetical protein
MLALQHLDEASADRGAAPTTVWAAGAVIIREDGTGSTEAVLLDAEHLDDGFSDIGHGFGP